MMNEERKRHLSRVLEKMVELLDITPAQYKEAVAKFEAVANYLKGDEEIAKYGLDMYAQGSFGLGTVTKPNADEDELDIDLVCELLNATHDSFSQARLKKLIGDRLLSGRYKDMTCQPDGRRCWRIDYAEDSGPNFHLDVLPAIPDGSPYIDSSISALDYSKTAISITDKESRDYSSVSRNWPKSNPRGYQQWFKSRMVVMLTESKRMFSELHDIRIEDVPDYEVKTPLQRAIQIMKRHRNEMFCKNDALNYDEKPISIIINTLAALAYDNQGNLYDALMNILERMPEFIQTRYVNGKAVKWIANPVDSRENFADKWEGNPVLERNFYLWHREMKAYAERLLTADAGHQFINDSLREGFGDKLMTKTFSALGDDIRVSREAGLLGVYPSTGIISEAAPKKVPDHNFHGSNKND